MYTRAIIQSLLAALLLVLSQAAAAILIVGKNSGLNQAEFLVDGDEISITNNSTGIITGFGFFTNLDDDDDLKLDEVSGTRDDDAWKRLSGNKDQGFEVAIGTGKNLFGGKVNKGIEIGETGIFEFDLEDDSLFESIYKVFVRFQETTNEEGSDKGYECLRDDDCKKISVPEPQTWALLAAGFIGLRISRRKH